MRILRKSKSKVKIEATFIEEPKEVTKAKRNLAKASAKVDISNKKLKATFDTNGITFLIKQAVGGQK